MTWRPDEQERPIYDDGYGVGSDGGSNSRNPHPRSSHAWKVWDWGWVRGLMRWIVGIRSRP